MFFDNPQIEAAFKKFSAACDKTIEFLKSEYNTLRAGRANPRLLDKIVVDYYGTMTALSQMANIATPDPRTLTISPWDKSTIKAISKAIMAANIGINPQDDGNIIRLAMPMVTQERRVELVKSVKKLAEEARVSTRNERRECLELLKKMKNDKVLTEDTVGTYEKELEKLVAKQMETIEKVAKDKEIDVMAV